MCESLGGIEGVCAWRVWVCGLVGHASAGHMAQPGTRCGGPLAFRCAIPPSCGWFETDIARPASRAQVAAPATSAAAACTHCVCSSRAGGARGEPVMVAGRTALCSAWLDCRGADCMQNEDIALRTEVPWRRCGEMVYGVGGGGRCSQPPPWDLAWLAF